MQVIQIGSIAILLKWLLLGLAILIALIIIKMLLKQEQEKYLHINVLDLLSNSLFIGFLIWKGSLLILEPSLVMKSPYSLLYFTGGKTGLFLAISCSTLYFLFRAWKLNIPHLYTLQTGFIFSFLVLSMYHILAFLFLNNHKMSHIILGMFTVFILSFSWFKKKMLSRQRIFTWMILFSFLSIFLSLLFENIDRKAYLFSIDQWFFIGIIMVSLFYWDRKSIS